MPGTSWVSWVRTMWLCMCYGQDVVIIASYLTWPAGVLSLSASSMGVSHLPLCSTSVYISINPINNNILKRFQTKNHIKNDMVLFFIYSWLMDKTNHRISYYYPLITIMIRNSDHTEESLFLSYVCISTWNHPFIFLVNRMISRKY